MPTVSPSRFFCLLPSAFCLLLACGGCKAYRALGTGQRIVPTRERARHDTSSGSEKLVVAVSTDAAGNIAGIEFIKHSRSQAVEQYVAQTIVDGFPRQPSTRTVVRLEHRANASFSDPEIVSTTPIQN